MTTVTKIIGPGKAILENALKDMDKLGAAAGWLGSTRYDTKDAPLVAKIATIQEFGEPSVGIPPRPFMRPAMADSSKRWAKIAQEKINELLEGKLQNAEQIVDAIASDAAGAIRRAISNVNAPPLKEATVKARLRRMSKSSQKKGITDSLRKPLVDTRYMINTITHFTFVEGDDS